MASSNREGIARWDNTVPLAGIARHHLSLFYAEQEKVAQIRKTIPTSQDEAVEQNIEAAEPQDAVDRHAHIVVVFTAFAVESNINSYGGRRLGDAYFEKHLDKLTTLSKWSIVPRLVTGKVFPTGGLAFNLLRLLFQWRNKIVHPKSRNVDLSNLDAEAAAISTKEKEFLAFIPRACMVFDELEKVARVLDPDDPFFGRF